MATKKSTKKNVEKKKVAPAVNSTALAVVSYQDIVQPEMHKGDMTSLASYFPKPTIQFITGPTPQKYILKREGTGGKMFDYIPGWYARKRANYAFGFNYDFEIKNKSIVGLSAIVEGRLIVNDPKSGRRILSKDDIGGHQIRFLKDKAKVPENAVDIANDYKSATTDALKRCMVQIGFFSDVYGVNEHKENGEQVVDMTENATVSKPKDADFKDAKVCCKCDSIIPEAGAKISKQIYGKHLCKKHFDELQAKNKKTK